MCCFGDYCKVSSTTLHVTAAIIWLCGVISVNAKLVVYLSSVSQGYNDNYDLYCFPDSSNNNQNRVYIPFLIGLFVAILETPMLYKFVLRNANRIDSIKLENTNEEDDDNHLINQRITQSSTISTSNQGGYIISKDKSCYEYKFLVFLTTIIAVFVIIQHYICGNAMDSEIVKGSKCAFIGLDACVGLKLLFSFPAFIHVFYKKWVNRSNGYELVKSSNVGSVGVGNGVTVVDEDIDSRITDISELQAAV